MKRNVKTGLAVSFLLLPGLLFSGPLELNWSWGLDRINRDDYFFIHLKPGFHYSFFRLKLSLPVEVNSNWTLYRRHWDDAKEDVLSKIETLSLTNRTFLFRISGLDGVALGNGELVRDYANDLWEPLSLKRGASLGASFPGLSLKLIMDDLILYERFLAEASFRKKRIRAGAAGALDRFRDRSALNFFAGYNLMSGSRTGLWWEADLVSDLKGGSFLSLGPHLVSGTLLEFSVKLKYYPHPEKEHLFISRFTVLERESDLVPGKGLGYSGCLGFNLFDFIRLDSSLNKVSREGPYSSLILRTGKRFPMKIGWTFSVYNAVNREWYDVFLEREHDTFMRIRTSLPLSKNLFLKLDYLKGFHRADGGFRGLHQVLFFTEFIF